MKVMMRSLLWLLFVALVFVQVVLATSGTKKPNPIISAYDRLLDMVDSIAPSLEHVDGKQKALSTLRIVQATEEQLMRRMIGQLSSENEAAIGVWKHKKFDVNVIQNAILPLQSHLQQNNFRGKQICNALHPVRLPFRQIIRRFIQANQPNFKIIAENYEFALNEFVEMELQKCTEYNHGMVENLKSAISFRSDTEAMTYFYQVTSEYSAQRQYYNTFLWREVERKIVRKWWRQGQSDFVTHAVVPFLHWFEAQLKTPTQAQQGSNPEAIVMAWYEKPNQSLFVLSKLLKMMRNEVNFATQIEEMVKNYIRYSNDLFCTTWIRTFSNETDTLNVDWPRLRQHHTMFIEFADIHQMFQEEVQGAELKCRMKLMEANIPGSL